MKNRTTSTIVALVLCACAFTPSTICAETDTRAEKARSLYQMGMVAINEGNFDLAKTSFKEVLKIYPNHPQARRQLIYISTNRNTLEIGRRKAALSKVIIPRANLDKATLEEALEMLAVQVERESNKKVLPNFIVQDPTGGFKGRTVTLRLSQIPAETMLRYIVEQVNGNIRFDNHAIVITPRSKGTVATPPAKDSILVK